MRSGMRLIFSTWRKSGSGFQDSNPLRELVIGVEIEHVFIGWNLLYGLNDGAGIEQIFMLLDPSKKLLLKLSPGPWM